MSQSAFFTRAFATTSPGLEPVLADELAALARDRRVANVRPGRAGVGFSTDRHGLERATMTLRTAHRVLWTLGEVDAFDAERLYHSVRALVRWQGLIPAERTFAVDATCRDTDAFRDARFAGLKVKDAIVDSVRDAVGARPDVSIDDPDVLVRVSIARGRGIVSLDAAGRTSLHARGYRTDAGEAPLRESLAAAMTLVAGWDPTLPLVDPFCGSGTILVEAALRARGIAPGLLRKDYGFARWPGFKHSRYQDVLAELAAATRARVDSPIVGLDVDAAVLEVARHNAIRAGVGGDVRFVTADARTVGADLPASGWIVANPPWGARMGDAAETVALLDAVRRHWSTGRWRVAMLVPDREAARAAGLDEPPLAVEAGGREVLIALGRWGRGTSP